MLSEELIWSDQRGISHWCRLIFLETTISRASERIDKYSSCFITSSKRCRSCPSLFIFREWLAMWVFAWLYLSVQLMILSVLSAEFSALFSLLWPCCRFHSMCAISSGQSITDDIDLARISSSSPWSSPRCPSFLSSCLQSSCKASPAVVSVLHSIVNWKDSFRISMAVYTCFCWWSSP